MLVLFLTFIPYDFPATRKNVCKQQEARSYKHVVVVNLFFFYFYPNL
jgi:hypothetical protein